MRIGSRPILYLLALTILFAVFGFLVWKFFATLMLAVVGWHVLRHLLRRAGLRSSRRRSSLPQWIEALSLGLIAAQFGGVTSKRERIPSGPQARYRRLRPRKPRPSAQVANDDSRWDDDPDWPYSPR